MGRKSGAGNPKNRLKIVIPLDAEWDFEDDLEGIEARCLPPAACCIEILDKET